MKTFSIGPGPEKSRIIPCPLCGQEKDSPAWKRDVLFKKCGKCGLIFQNPQPVQEDVIHRYDKDYFSYELENETNFFQLMLLSLQDIGFFDLEREILALGGPFLDVGCATGMLISYLRDKGFPVKGVEVCAGSAEYGRKTRGVDIINSTLQEAELPAESLSVLHSSHLIEHLTDPKGFVREAYKLLKPKGYFICTTPNSSGFQAIITGGGWRSAISDHMVLFSKRTLAYMVQEAGFKILKIKTWGGIAKGLAPGFIKAPADILAKLFGFGDVMIILARKV